MTVTGSAAPGQGRIGLKGEGGGAADSTVRGDGYRLRPDGEAWGHLLDPICFRQPRSHFTRMPADWQSESCICASKKKPVSIPAFAANATVTGQPPTSALGTRRQHSRSVTERSNASIRRRQFTLHQPQLPPATGRQRFIVG